MSEKGKVMSLSAIGLDAPGLVSTITTKIFDIGGNIIDVEENCRRGLFSIFLIVDFSGSPYPLPEITRILHAVQDETGLKVVLGIYDEKELPSSTSKENHVLTILGEDRPGIIARVSTFFHKHHINIESCRMIARGELFCMELAIDTYKMHVAPQTSRDAAIERMKEELKELCKALHQSVVIQSEDIYNRRKKLIVFDVESTLIQEASLKQFLARVERRVESTGMPMDSIGKKEDLGRIQALAENARLLKGIPLAELERWGEVLQVNPGALELIGILKSMGFRIALLSSGFSFFMKKIFEAAGVDYAFSNTLKANEKGLLTGEIEDPVITDTTKKEILEFIMDVEHISPEQVIAVGDGSTRSHFMKDVGLSIAIKPPQAGIPTDGVFKSDRFMHLLYCLGIPKSECEKYLPMGN